MTSTIQTYLRVGLLASLLIPSALQAAGPEGAKNLRPPMSGAATVDMFAGIESGDLEVRFIPKDEFEARVMIKNNTKQPLNVQLPEVFAGVPALLQRVGGGGGGGRGGGGQGGQQQQSVGGGMGMGGGMGGGGMGMGGGMFSVPPEQVGQFQVATVCLEHGKKVPRAAVPYEIRPLDDVTTNPGVRELLTAYGSQQLNQRATQAAAWNLANGLSWEELAAKRLPLPDGSSESWFSPQEIAAATQFATAARVQAEQNKRKSPSDNEAPSDSLSSGAK